MQNTLDFSEDHFSKLIDRAKMLILDQHRNQEEKKAFHYYPQTEVYSWFDESLPTEGMEIESLMDEVKEKVLDKATNNLGHHMYAYVMAGGNHVSILAEMLANTINQNQTKWHLAPSMTEIERRVIAWTAELLQYEKNAGGIMVSGGSAANLHGLTVARNIYFEQEDIKQKGLFGMQPFTVYTSDQVHSCIDKSVQVLGIGTNQLRKIPTDDQFRIDTKQLRTKIEKDLNSGYRPFCIVGTAGTVNTGAIDDLDELANIAQEYKMWLHVDGAYGGLVASLENFREAYKGLDRADSIALDFHKWLYQPFEAGCTLVKSWSQLKRTYFKQAEYLDTSLEGGEGRLDINEHHFQLSRNAKAFKVWMSLKTYGAARIKSMIQKDIDLTHYLERKIAASEDFEMAAPSGLAVACFRYTANMDSELEIASFTTDLIPALEKDGRVFITGTKLNDKLVLRACIINHRKTEASIDYLLDVIRDVGKSINR